MTAARGLTRRRLLAFASAVAATSPPLAALLAKIARGEAARPPLRFYFMFTGNGQMPEHWVPGTSPDGTLALAPVFKPLQPFADRLLLVRGLRGVGDHPGGMAETTTGRPGRGGSAVPSGGPSIDQFFAEAWRGGTPLSSLELGAWSTNHVDDQTSYSVSGLPLPAIASPLGGFERAFGNRDEEAEAVAQRRMLESSVLDSVAQDLNSLQQQLGPDARILLDEHLTLVRAQERALRTPAPALDCTAPAAPSGAGPLSGIWKAQHATIAAAFRCGVTRVASVRAGGLGGVDPGGYAELGITDAHHSIAHGNSDDPIRDELAINLLHAQQLAHLLEALETAPEGDGTLLDNTVVVWFNELGLGPVNNHGRFDQHVVIAGGRNAGLNLGRYFDLGGAHYHDFLLTLVHALGHRDVTRFGDEGVRVIPDLFA